MNSKLKILCELYDRSDENIDVDVLFKICFFKDLEEVLSLLSYRQCVTFGYLCSKSVLHLNNKDIKEKPEKCLKLVEKWLENPNSVSRTKLRVSAHIAFTASNNTGIYSVGACACAAYSIYDTIFIYCVDSSNSAAKHSIGAAEDKQKQEYKNLGFLVKVIRDGENR